MIATPAAPVEKAGRRAGWQAWLRFAPWLIFGLVLLLNLATVWLNNFDGLYGQDAYSYFAHATELYSRQSLFHHWQWEAGPRILYWPFGYPGLVAVLFLLTGPTAGAAQLVSLVCWAGVAGLVTAIGQLLWVERFSLAGPVAGLLIGLSPLGRQAAITIMSDAAALFWTTLSVYLLLKSRGRLSYRYAAGAGLALGLAAITRYAALTALPLLLLVFVGSGVRGQRLKWLGIAFGLAGLVYLPQFIINQLYPEPLWSNSWLTGWSPLNALQTSFATRDGLASYTLPPLLFYIVYPLFNLHFFTPAVIIPLGAGLSALWQRREKAESLLLAGWWLLSALLLSLLPYESERYSLTFMPPIALVAGLGTAWLWQWLRNRRLQIWRQAGLVTIGLGLLGLLVVSQLHLNGFMAVKAGDLAVARQLGTRIPKQATVITFEISLTLDHYTSFPVRDLWFFDPAQLPGLLNGQTEVYLLADPQQMAKQWTGTPVGEAFTAVQKRTSGEPLAKLGRYWLWRVG